MGEQGMNAITVRNITKSYGGTRVLADFSCAFERGRVTSVMGPSGCGKTTLMRLILGLEAPDRGEIERAEGTVFSCVFQEDRLISHLSTLKNLRLVMPRRDDTAAKRLLIELGLGDSVHRPVRELSGGMARRVAIARALISDADTVIMDEPLKGLDVYTYGQVLEVIRRRIAGRTLILVTHDVTEAEYFGGEKVKLGFT
ncbi:MAG: ABC transporter ATP-binding protein [Clostridia bacterium]|nr:ABC transporter ATP-binding protein [Clostridia bacterium]